MRNEEQNTINFTNDPYLVVFPRIQQPRSKNRVVITATTQYFCHPASALSVGMPASSDPPRSCLGCLTGPLNLESVLYFEILTKFNKIKILTLHYKITIFHVIKSSKTLF